MGGNSEPTITDVLVTLARLEGKLDASTAEHSTRLATLERESREHEAKAAAVEKDVSGLKTKVGGVYLVAGVLAVLIGWTLSIVF